MGKNKVIIGFFSVLAAGLGAFLLTDNESTDATFERESRYLKARYEDKQQGAAEYMAYMAELRKDSKTGKVNLALIKQAQERALQMEKTQKQSRATVALEDWTELGPYNHGGRIRGFIIDRNDHNKLYAAGVSGGIFMSVNAGLDWQYIQSYEDLGYNLNVTALCQTTDGAIYAGTGEGSAITNPFTGDGNGSSQFPGDGVYKSTDGGVTWTQLADTDENVEGTSGFSMGGWSEVSALAAHPSQAGVLYAATGEGLYKIVDDGVTAPERIEGGAFVDVISENDGTNSAILASNGNTIYVSKDGNTFTSVESDVIDDLGAKRRIDVAIAPSDVNYMYASIVNSSGCLGGIVQSKDMGTTWEVIGQGGSGSFEPFASHCQGWYDNVIGVSAHYPEVIYVGGVELWSWIAGDGWNRIANTFQSGNPTFYVHADVHMIQSHPTDTGKIYIGTDGGIFVTEVFKYAYTHMTHGFKTMQCYDADINVDGKVITGFQDNGTHIIDFFDDESEVLTNSVNVHGGDGGSVEASDINTDVFIGQSQLGNVKRSSNAGGAFNLFYDINIVPEAEEANIGENNSGFDFVTPFYLWEQIGYNGVDTVISAMLPTEPDTPNVSLNNYVLDTVLDTLQDAARFYIAKSTELWVTREVLDAAVIPEWYRIARGLGSIRRIMASEDGNHVFVGTTGGIYRVSGINNANFGYYWDASIKQSTNADGEAYYEINKSFDPDSVGIEVVQFREPSGNSVNWGSAVSGIAIDPNNPNRMVITMSEYGSHDRVFITTNALDSLPTFTNISGNSTTGVPEMPIYSAVIDAEDGNNIYVGTDYGVYATSSVNGSSTQWAYVGPSRVPVFELVQKDLSANLNVTGHSLVAGTHGRGVWGANFDPCAILGLSDEACGGAMSIDEQDDLVLANSLHVYPNPMSDEAFVSLHLKEASEVTVNVLNINGELVTSSRNNFSEGMQQIRMDVSSLDNGIYFFYTQVGTEVYTNKAVILK